MGSTGRDDHSCSNRRPPIADSDATDKALVSDSCSNPAGFQLGFNESAHNLGSNPNFDSTDRGCYTEEKLAEMMLKKLESGYNEAIDKLVALGYAEGVVKKAILRSGHCCGDMDALTNIFHNTQVYLNNPQGKSNDTKQVFPNLKRLIEFSLAFLVCLLKRVKPCLSEGDAMWCLLMSDLDVGRASAMELPVVRNPSADGNSNSESSSHAINNMEKVNNDSIGVTPASCRFHGGWWSGNRGTADFPVNRSLSHADSEETSQMDIGFPYLPELSPTMNMLLKRKQALSSWDSSSAVDTGGKAHPPDYTEESLERRSVKDQEEANMMLKKFRDLNLEGDAEFVPEDQKDEMLLSLVHEIMDLERQVKERKEWAHQKAMQAARKLSHDLTELKMLRMEQEENQQHKQGKPTAEDPTMKRLSEMESALREVSVQVDRANLVVRCLEVENAEIRAEMEASKLSASESVTMCLEVSRREKKYLRRLLTWEKRRAKLQEDITSEKQKIIELQEELLQVEAAKKTAEAKLMKEQTAKEHVLTQVEEERRLKEATKANNKRKHEALRSKIELHFQRYKDDLQRLEQELSRIKTSTDPDQESIDLAALEIPYGFHPHSETIASLLHRLDDSEDKEDEIGRACVICLKDEVSVVFLPCAHQVLCTSCNDEYGKNGNAKCPTCRVSIEQRIRVFGTSS